MNKEEIIEDIAKAIYVKKRLDGQTFPKSPQDSIGKHLIIPDMERSNEDLMEDKARNEAMKHPELVDIVFKDWLSDLCPLEFLTVYYRLCYSFLSGKVLPWKEVSNRLYKSDITERYYSRRHLLRIFNDTIRKIERKI